MIAFVISLLTVDAAQSKNGFSNKPVVKKSNTVTSTGSITTSINNSKSAASAVNTLITAAVIEKHCPTVDIAYNGIKLIHNDPPVFEISNFFSADECMQYQSLAISNGMKIGQSQTFSATASSIRTSTTWYMKYQDVLSFIHKANMLTGIPIDRYEEPQVVQYQTGQQFSFHYDAIPKSLLDSSGQRLATLIVYLNDVPLGGATVFKDIPVKVQPKAGKALLFFPSYSDGTPDDRTLHCGQVSMDTKWIAQLWMHQHAYHAKAPEGSSVQEAINMLKQQQQQQQL